tara:strand:+ start:413 stop:757 length:345 start_codon:yes stop_codon:yes gene_type:complete
MSDPIDSILTDTLLLLIFIAIIMFVAGGIMWVFRVSASDETYRKRYRQKSRIPRLRIPSLNSKKRKKRNIDPRYTYIGPQGMWNVFMNPKTGKTIYKNRKTGEVKDNKVNGVMV